MSKGIEDIGWDPEQDNASACPRSPWYASAFGGPKVVVGPRLEPVARHLSVVVVDADLEHDDIAAKLLASKEGNGIQ